MNRGILPDIVMGIEMPIPPTALRSRPSQAAALNWPVRATRAIHY